MWVFRSGEDEGAPIVLYRYYKTRDGANAAEFLKGYKGYIMTDGYSGYNVVPAVTRTACWAHVRQHTANNASERAVQQVVIGRKNWLFAVVLSGAQASAVIHTMVEMARENGVNIYQYLTYLLEKCPTSQTSDEEFEKLAPWNSEVKRITEERSQKLRTA